MREDKRLQLVVGVILLVLFLGVIGRTPSDAVLTLIGSLVTAYIVQSQWGQTKREVAGAQPPPG